MTRSSPSMNQLHALLDRERAAFLVQVERVPRSRQSERPAPDRWSVIEVVEHVSRIDTGITKLLEVMGAQPLTANLEALAQAQMSPEKAASVRNRGTRIEAPERVRPTGKLSSEEALAQLAAGRVKLKAASLAADPAVLDGAVYSHAVLGPLTLRAWLELTAHHDARHAQQVAEIAEQWGTA